MTFKPPPKLPDLSRLQANLLNSGLQTKDNPLFQVIDQLIKYLQAVQLATSAILAGGGSGGGTSNIIIQQGPPGMMGEDGLDGLDGIPGIIGRDGRAGAAGLTGPPGIDGLDGEDGRDSIIPGPVGNTGATGIGTPGITGPPGIDGLDGADGSDGISIIGPSGPQGIQGIQGISGSRGEIGPIGIPGLDAEECEISLIPGPMGPRGFTGIQGELGPQGLDAEEPEYPYIIPGLQGKGSSATIIESNLGSTPTWRGKFTITDALISGSSKVIIQQAPGPYTGKGTRADEAEMDPIFCYAEPGVGQAIVKWNTLPMITYDGINNNLNTNNLNPSNYLQPARRLGKVKGNVKFQYMVL